MFRCLLLVTTFLLFLLPLFAQNPPRNAPEINFMVSMTKPHTHLFDVDIQIKRRQTNAGPGPDTETLIMPVWTPGSYLIREFERHVQDFSATDPQGHALSWEKINKNSWRVTTGGAQEWHASYRVYANELTVRTSELNSDHGFWNNSNLLMYLDGFLSSSSTLRVKPPAGWAVATGLPSLAGEENTFRADSFDVLYDSPVEAGKFKVLGFMVQGVPHRIIIDGEGNYDPERLRRDVQKIVEAEVAIMGGEIPYHDYTFILHLRLNAGGGLEHLNSTALGYASFGFKPDRVKGGASASPTGQPQQSYANFLSLVSHEFFHLWNVKRIRPDVLGPFDYTKENYTKLLWVAEGFTDYYAQLALRRAGLITEQDFLEDRAKDFSDLQDTPGRLEQSVEEASYDAWIKFYRQDENSVNSQVSYYDKGGILGLLLDLEIRKLSHGARTLDDVMRYLYAEFYKKSRNYSPTDFQRACELMAGAKLDSFFGRYVHGKEELDYESALNAAGLHLEAGASAATDRAFFGADLVGQNERLLVRSVRSGSPAYEQGLNAGDQIVAFDGIRATQEFVTARLAEKRPGDVVRLTVFRFDQLRTIELKLGQVPHGDFRIVSVAQPSEEQHHIHEAWLGTRP